jgi:hypothetical protein
MATQPYTRRDRIRERLLSDEAIDAAEATSSRRALRSEEETERYKQRLRAVLTAALDAVFPEVDG